MQLMWTIGMPGENSSNYINIVDDADADESSIIGRYYRIKHSGKVIPVNETFDGAKIMDVNEWEF